MGASFSCHPLRVYVCGFGCAVQLFATLWTAAGQDPQSVEFSRQEDWSGLPCFPPGDLPNPGMELESLMSPAWRLGSLPLAPPGKPILWYHSKEDWMRSWYRESSSRIIQPLLTGFEWLCCCECHIPPLDVPQDHFASLKHHRKALGRNPARSEWYM